MTAPRSAPRPTANWTCPCRPAPGEAAAGDRCRGDRAGAAVSVPRWLGAAPGTGGDGARGCDARTVGSASACRTAAGRTTGRTTALVVGWSGVDCSVADDIDGVLTATPLLVTAEAVPTATPRAGEVGAGEVSTGEAGAVEGSAAGAGPETCAGAGTGAEDGCCAGGAAGAETDAGAGGAAGCGAATAGAAGGAAGAGAGAGVGAGAGWGAGGASTGRNVSGSR